MLQKLHHNGEIVTNEWHDYPVEERQSERETKFTVTLFTDAN